ncbi:MAG: virulence RhuM family protein [Phycisphaerae bacterium]|nr:virulence RhuM family protein [Phycisphaerae bacterium]
MNGSPNLPSPSGSNIIVYQSEDGRTRIDVRLDGQTVWLSQALLAELFQTSVPNISMHVRNIFQEGELESAAVVKEYLTTAADGKNYRVTHYNLEMILAVGYRVRSHRGTQFRRWATQTLHGYLVKGFALDDQRLKEGRSLGADYFDELLERIRDIRASEKRFYQKIRDIYALAIDYDPKAPQTQEFFQIVQNKLHWAITGHTTAELIALRAGASKPNMGLTTWKGAKVRTADVTVAKNYLNEDELRQLNRTVTMYLDYAEEQAERRQPLYMRDWRDKLDGFLKFNDRAVLAHAGHVSMEGAKRKALEQYARFNEQRLAEEASAADDEFEQEAKRLESLPPPKKMKSKPKSKAPPKPRSKRKKRQGKRA